MSSPYSLAQSDFLFSCISSTYSFQESQKLLYISLIIYWGPWGHGAVWNPAPCFTLDLIHNIILPLLWKIFFAANLISPALQLLYLLLSISLIVYLWKVQSLKCLFFYFNSQYLCLTSSLWDATLKSFWPDIKSHSDCRPLCVSLRNTRLFSESGHH